MSIPWDGFMLGLSSGVSCLATCAPVLLPCLLGEGRGLAGSAVMTGQFLMGRLAGYLLFAVLAWIAGRVLLPEGAWHDLLIGAAYAGFAAVLVHYGFFKKDECCEAGCRKLHKLPLTAGFVTGLAFCPPILLAFTAAAGQPSLWGSILFFLAFFAGTSMFLIPAPLAGFFRGAGALRTIGRMAAGIMGLYFLYSGILLAAGGLSALSR